MEPAAAELAKARRLVGDDRYSSIARLQALGSWGAPKVRTYWRAPISPVCARPDLSEE